MIFRLLFTLILLSHWNLATALELEVEIEGLDDALEKNVRHFLIIEREKGRAELTTGRVHHLHKQAPEQIRKALQPYGFFRSTTEAELLSNDKGFVAHYRVVTGEAVRLKQVAFLVEGPGRDDPVLTAGFPLVAGDALNQTAYEKAKDEVLSTAVEAGYLDARFAVHELRVDLDSYSASIDLRWRVVHATASVLSVFIRMNSIPLFCAAISISKRVSCSISNSCAHCKRSW